MDITQQYRHGILIGNWNEDQWGVEHVRNEPQRVDPAFHYMSITKASFQHPPQDTLGQFVENQAMPAKSASFVDRGLLFRHKGAEPNDTRYLTSYNTAFQGGYEGKSRDASMDGKLNEWRKAEVAVRDCSISHQDPRALTYVTTSKQIHNEHSTTLKQPVTAEHVSNYHKCNFASVLDAPFNNIGLRGSKEKTVTRQPLKRTAALVSPKSRYRSGGRRGSIEKQSSIQTQARDKIAAPAL